MKLVAGLPNIVEYPLNLTTDPPLPRVAEVTRLNFGVEDPKTLQPVRHFEVVHEKLYHVFLVSQDLSFFLHTHPERQPNEDFHLDVHFPKPGMYRILSDFYPTGGTPQLITDTVLVPGDGFSLKPASIPADLSPKQTENSHVELELEPEHPIAGQKVSLLYRVTPDENVELYLGTWAHMLAASSDLIDMIHTHPTGAIDARGNSYKEIQFSLLFPRAGMYRVWTQFQRQGVVNTVAFNIPVAEAIQ